MFAMHRVFQFAVAALALTVLRAGAADIKTAEDLKDARQKASYGLGLQTARNWERQSVDIDWDAYFRGLNDGRQGAAPLLTDQQIREAMDDFRKDVQAAQKAKLEEEGTKNKAAGEKFLAENKTKEGVQTTASGLQYKVVQMGTGPKPKTTDKVTVQYTGKLIDGKKFDSSLDRGKPATFSLNSVIPGWTEGLQLMPVGSKFEFYIPSELAYKDHAPSAIGPDQVLVFDVELLSIETPPPPKPVTSDIIKVPSAEELAKGAKIEVIKPEDVQKEIEKEKEKAKDKTK